MARAGLLPVAPHHKNRVTRSGVGGRRPHAVAIGRAMKESPGCGWDADLADGLCFQVSWDNYCSEDILLSGRLARHRRLLQMSISNMAAASKVFDNTD